MAANGISLRATSTFVTDGAGDTYSLGAAYPETRSGETFGWSADSTGNARDRDTIRPKHAGIVFQANGGGTRYFRWDKPAGTYSIRVALGDSSNLQTNKLVIRDGVGGTVLATIAGNTGVAEFLDASGALRAGMDGIIQSIWERDNVAISLTQASGAFVFEIGDTAAGSAATALAYVSVVAVGPVLTGNITADDAIASGSAAPAPPTGLSGNVTADEAVASGTAGQVMSSVATFPFRRNPGSGAAVVSVAGVGMRVLADDVNLGSLSGSVLNLGSDGRLVFANGVPVPAGTSVIVLTREPGANGALGVERYVTY